MSYGLVLAGGGGKGAYQIGAWKAMKELGIDKSITAVSGTSVGALNAALFCQGDFLRAENVWNSISNELLLKDRPAFDSGSGSTGNIMYDLKLADNKGLKMLIERNIEFEKISASKLGLFVCCTEVVSAARDLKSARYVRLNNKDRHSMLNFLLASAALPFAYGRQNFGGRSYLDGGLIDNVPFKPLLDAGYKKLIVIHLDRYSQSIRRAVGPGIKVIDVIPQNDLGDLLNGTLDFSKEGVRSRMNSGYYEALAALKPYLKEFQSCSYDKSSIRDMAHKITNPKNSSVKSRIKNAVKDIVK